VFSLVNVAGIALGIAVVVFGLKGFLVG